MEPVNIPSYIDDPPHFLLWSADEMAPILLGLRDGRPDGFILHAIYWGGLLPTKAKTIPNPFIRSYLP